MILPSGTFAVKQLWPGIRAFRKSELDKQEAKGLVRVSLIETHLVGNSGDMQKIHESQQGVIEGCQDLGSPAGAHLRVILPPSVTSRRQCERFSMPQCPLLSSRSRLAEACLGD